MERCPYCFKPLPEYGTCDCRYEESENARIEDTLRPGAIVGAAYQIGAVLGKGGFGITYRGFDLNNERVVAIKEFYPDGMVTRGRLVSNFARSRSTVMTLTERNLDIYKKSLKLFYREAQALSKLGKQPNVVHAHSIFHENGTAYIVMEFVEGKSLKQMIQERGRIPEAELIRLLDPALAALGKVHEAEILHRDIAPDNIMIEDGQPVLIDFGAARVEEGHASSLLIGKRGFSSPEQMAGGAVDCRSDIYSFGATYYKALSGETPQDAVLRTLGDQVKPLKELVPGISQQVSDAVMKAMSIKPEDRWNSAEEFRNALNEIVQRTQSGPIKRGYGQNNGNENKEKEKQQSKRTQAKGENKGKNGKALWLVPLLLVLFAGGFLFYRNYYQKNQNMIATLDAYRLTEIMVLPAKSGQDSNDVPDQISVPALTSTPLPTKNGTLIPTVTNTSVSTNTPMPTVPPINVNEIFTLGHQAFEEKDYEKALPLLRQAAEAGNADAMVDLGRMYNRGSGVEEDDTQAVSWFRKAAEKGHAGGQYWMGVMYRDGGGVTRDYTQAYEWFLKAADQGDANAQYAIGQFYETDNYNLPQDYNKAYEWYLKAADNGADAALVALGRMYEYGRGFEKDEKKALEWYRKAADHGSDYAMIRIGSLYQSQKNFSEAEKWYLKAIEQHGPNSAYAEFEMGSLYDDHYFNENASEAEKKANYEKSREWYLKAAEDGYTHAWNTLGYNYFIGYNFQQSYEKALYYFQQGAAAGDTSCMMDIAEMYYRGYGVPISYEITIKYLQLAMEKEHFGAYLQLGLLYEYGIGAARNKTEAQRLYRYVAEHGDSYIIDTAQKLLDGNRANIPSYIDPLYQELLTRISLGSYQLFWQDVGNLSDRYVLMDLDGNGTDELVIGSAYHTESIYAVKNGYMEDILKELKDDSYDTYNPYYTLCKNKVIQKEVYVTGYPGVSSYESYYGYTGNGFSFIEAIVQSESYDYYHSTSSEISLSGQKLDWSGKIAIEDRYPEMDLNWIMLK